MNSDQLRALADALEPMAKAPRFEDFDVPAFCAWVRACADAEPVARIYTDAEMVHRDERYTQLEAERDELRRQLAEAELDAERYRWLRNEASTARKCDPMVCIYPLDEQDLIDGDRLDVAIDAVMGASNE